MKVVAKSVCVFPYRNGKFLMLHRIPKKGGFWQGVTGRIEKGETALQAASREVQEETGLTPLKVFPVEAVNAYFDAAAERMNLEPTFGAPMPPGDVLLSREHDAFRWTSFDEAIKLLRWSGNKAGLRALKEEIDA